MSAVVETRMTNKTRVALSIAVWLADDEYDYIDIPNYISVTTLIKHPRQIILGMRLPKSTSEGRVMDVADAMARKLGTAIHGSIEDVWLHRYKENLNKLAYPEHIIDRILVNPAPEELFEDCIPIYMERRSFHTQGKYTIGGKFDFVGDGILEDFKSTGTYSFTSGSNEWKYRLQLSLYRWLNQDIITNDIGKIQFIFTDWSSLDAMVKTKQGYPPTRMYEHKVRLMSVAETEVWVRQRIAEIDMLMDVPEAELPLCDAQALWQDKPVYKYYKNPEKTQRSSGNFPTYAEAQIKWITDGRVGIIKEVFGEAKGCRYCDAFGLCSQKDTLIANGNLKIKEDE
jgi:hypothetical protein